MHVLTLTVVAHFERLWCEHDIVVMRFLVACLKSSSCDFSSYVQRSTCSWVTSDERIFAFIPNH